MPSVSDIGERSLIQKIMKHLSPMPGMPIPFWDDASALSIGDGRAIVVNTDMLVWETDIPHGMTPYQAARKAVVMNVSDLGAKGVQPIIFMPNIGIPSDYDVNNVVNMAKGFEAGAKEYGAYVVGGDTNEACDIIISGLALGVVDESLIMKRAGGVQPGDKLAVTGYFGLTSLGFAYLLNGIDLHNEAKEAAMESIYMPSARIKEGIALANTRVVTSCMDSSDGLSVSLHDLKRSTGLGFIIEDPPIHPLVFRITEKENLDPISLALNGGEEYELVFTYPPEEESKINASLQGVGCKLINIGVVSDNQEIYYRENENLIPLKPGGWDHFRMYS
jgi:thiamine-monophosphate kinase